MKIKRTIYKKAVLTAFGKRLVGVVLIPIYALNRPYFLAHRDYKRVSLDSIDTLSPIMESNMKKARFEYHGHWWKDKPELDFIGFD